jgi:hypothetical protein
MSTPNADPAEVARERRDALALLIARCADKRDGHVAAKAGGDSWAGVHEGMESMRLLALTQAYLVLGGWSPDAAEKADEKNMAEVAAECRAIAALLDPHD